MKEMITTDNNQEIDNNWEMRTSDILNFLPWNFIAIYGRK